MIRVAAVGFRSHLLFSVIQYFFQSCETLEFPLPGSQNEKHLCEAVNENDFPPQKKCLNGKVGKSRQIARERKFIFLLLCCAV